MTENGIKQIKDIKVGDMVWSMNESGEKELCKVLGTTKTKKPQVRIKTATGMEYDVPKFRA